MKILGRGNLGPVGRFSLALAGILLVTAVAVAGVTSYLLDRYVQDETTRFTRDAVASHFGPVFEEDVFQRPLATEERGDGVRVEGSRHLRHREHVLAL
jgi:hypothetical protein